MHPLLESALVIFSSELTTPVKTSTGGYDARRIYSSKEYATSPASKSIVVELGEQFEVTRDTGVTVRELLRETGVMLEEKVGTWSLHYRHGEDGNCCSWGERYIEEGAVWRGWQRPRVCDGDVVLLRPNALGRQQ